MVLSAERFSIFAPMACSTGEEQRKAALEALFRTLLHHLMTGKVRIPVAGDVGAHDVGAHGRAPLQRENHHLMTGKLRVQEGS